jgi:hypothetical protein
MSTKKIENETRKSCLEVMRKAEQEAKAGKDVAENDAKEVAQYCAKLEDIFSSSNPLTDWSTMYCQWWDNLPFLAKWRTYNLFWYLLHCLNQTAYTIACFSAATKGYEVGRFSNVMAPIWRDVQDTTRKDLLADFYKYLEEIGKVFGMIEKMGMNLKITPSKAQYLYPEWPEAVRPREATKDHAATALESIIFALSEFKKVMYIACNYRMRYYISHHLICFLNTADILCFVRKFSKTSFPASQLSVVFKLVGELAATLVSEEEKETMQEIFNEMALHIMSFFLYFCGQKEEDGLVDELSERIDGTPAKNAVASAVSGLIYRLVEIIAISKNTLLVSEAQKTMDDMFKMIAARIAVLKDTAALSAKMKKLAKEWMDLMKKRGLITDPFQTVNGAMVKRVTVQFETEQGGWHTVKIPSSWVSSVNVTPIVKVTVKREMRERCSKQMNWAGKEAANYIKLAKEAAQAAANCVSQLQGIYPVNQQQLTDWGKYDLWCESLYATVREQIDGLFRAVGYTLAYAAAAFAFACTVKVWAKIAGFSYWMNPKIVSAAIHLAELMCKEASRQGDDTQNMGDVSERLLLEQLQQRGKDFTAIWSIFGEFKSLSKTEDLQQQALSPLVTSQKQTAKDHMIQAAEAALYAITQFKETMDGICHLNIRSHVYRHLNTFLMDASIWRLASGSFVKNRSNSCLAVVPQFVSGLVEIFCRRVTDKITLDKVIDQITMYIICHLVYFNNDQDGDRLKLRGELSILLHDSIDDLTKDADADVVCKSVCSLVQAIAVAKVAKNAFFVVEARKAMDKMMEMIAKYVEPLKNETLSDKVAGLMEKWRGATHVLDRIVI